MNIKIQGGKGTTYANKGSSSDVASYLEHEDYKRMENGQEIEHFFDQTHDRVSTQDVTQKIDNNRAKLCKDDAKFFVITVSPSEKEIRALGNTPDEQSKNLKAYIRNEVMPAYAQGFKKGLSEKDIMYYAKVHHEREKNSEVGLHAHIIVSRKDMNGTKKLSPMTNHKTAGKGAIKSGFSRNGFYASCEKGFDKHTRYQRQFTETFEYNNGIKKGSPELISELTSKAVKQEVSQQKALTEKLVKEALKIKDKGRDLSRGLSL